MKLTMWLKERELNARRLAAGRTGADRAGWLEDADHFQAALAAAEDCARLRAALRQVAQAHAWQAFGDCRSFGADVALLSPSDADAVARVALGELREGPNVNSQPHPVR